MQLDISSTVVNDLTIHRLDYIQYAELSADGLIKNDQIYLFRDTPVDERGRLIHDVVEPIEETDVANKKYVDDSVANLQNNIQTIVETEILPIKSEISEITTKVDQIQEDVQTIVETELVSVKSEISTLSDNISTTQLNISDLSILIDQLAKRKIKIIDFLVEPIVPSYNQPETVVKYLDRTISSYNIDGIISGNNSPTTQITNVKDATDISVGNSVTSITNWAFAYCSSLTSIILPDSVKSIGNYTFYNSSLPSIIIPDSISSIGKYAFYSCPLSSIIIPDSISSTNTNAFQYCGFLTTVTLGNSIKTIGSNTFYGCSSLTSINLPSSLTKIGDYVFFECSSLTSLTLPSSLTSIGTNAFQYCLSTCQITFDRTMSQVSSMSNKYWGISTGNQISCTDGVITITGSSTGQFAGASVGGSDD